MRLGQRILAVLAFGLLVVPACNQGTTVIKKKEPAKPKRSGASASQPIAEGRAGVVEFTQQYERMFANREPWLDSEAPDVSALDEAGKPFSLSDSRGNYTVIAFGCLT